MPYECAENCCVGTLLQNVKGLMPNKLKDVDVDDLQLFPCEWDANDPSKAWIACMIVVCHNDCRPFDMWDGVAVAKVVILCCILSLHEAFQEDDLVREILGDNSRTAPFYVHCDDRSQAPWKCVFVKFAVEVLRLLVLFKLVLIQSFEFPARFYVSSVLLIDATLLITVHDTTALVRSIGVLASDLEVVISTVCYCCHCQSAPLCSPMLSFLARV